MKASPFSPVTYLCSSIEIETNSSERQNWLVPLWFQNSAQEAVRRNNRQGKQIQQNGLRRAQPLPSPNQQYPRFDSYLRVLRKLMTAQKTSPDEPHISDFKLSSPSPWLWQITGAVWQEIGRKSRRMHRNVPSFGKLTPLFHNISGVLQHLHTVEVIGSNPIAPTIQLISTVGLL